MFQPPSASNPPHFWVLSLRSNLQTELRKDSCTLTGPPQLIHHLCRLESGISGPGSRAQAGSQPPRPLPGLIHSFIFPRVTHEPSSYIPGLGSLHTPLCSLLTLSRRPLLPNPELNSYPCFQKPSQPSFCKSFYWDWGDGSVVKHTCGSFQRTQVQF